MGRKKPKYIDLKQAAGFVAQRSDSYGGDKNEVKHEQTGNHY